MKRYKDGKMIDIPENEVERIKRHVDKHRNSNKTSLIDYETRIKYLEDSVAAILSQLNKEKASDEV